MLIDTHAHLNFNAYKDDLDDVIKKTLKNDTWIINVGSQSSTSKRAIEIAKKYKKGVFASVGLHPTHLYETHVDIQEANANFKSRAEVWDKNFYKELAKDPHVVAIGEMGLDYHFIPDSVDFEKAKRKQQEVFIEGLELADELNLPIIIHSRDVHDDIIPILKKFIDKGKLKRRGVLHCYTGNWHYAKQYLKMGFLISFTGIITFTPKKKQQELQEQIWQVVQNIPVDKFMIETDCPYLAPEPFRGKRNEPAFVEYVAKKVAEIKNITLEEVAKFSTKTAKKFFKI